jgi:protein TonB
MKLSHPAGIGLADDAVSLTSTPFVIALAASIIVHGIMLNVRFGFLNPNLFKPPSNALEVVLVNSKSASRPVKADVLAQANLDGGGNTDEERRAKTPLPVTQKENTARDETTMSRRVRDLEQKAKSLLTQIKSKKAIEPPPQETRTEQAPAEAPEDVVEKSLQMARLEAQIARRMEAYQQRPKRQFVGARAQEYRFARYVDEWREKVERVGNINYPEEAKVKKLYGRLQLTVAIRGDGSVERVDVNRSSGHNVLDEAAKRIVFLAAPFAKFPEDIARDTDILEITRTWTFTREDQMVSE